MLVLSVHVLADRESSCTLEAEEVNLPPSPVLQGCWETPKSPRSRGRTRRPEIGGATSGVVRCGLVEILVVQVSLELRLITS